MSPHSAQLSLPPACRAAPRRAWPKIDFGVPINRSGRLL